MWWSNEPYVSVAQRRANAMDELKALENNGVKAQPVQIEGKKITTTFWGTAWCNNLESYSDFESRLPRGRSYVRNGSVCDLRIEPGQVIARVCGSSLYKIEIKIKPVAAERWTRIQRDCAGQIGSMIELLQGKLSQRVMEIVTSTDGGLFPSPAEIAMKCSCPDWADMCKHVAATLYGVGARLDQQPELLFVLREVNHLDLINRAGDIGSLTRDDGTHKTIAADTLSDVFGIELAALATSPLPTKRKPPTQSAKRSKPQTQTKKSPSSTAKGKNKPPKPKPPRQAMKK